MLTIPQNVDPESKKFDEGFIEKLWPYLEIGREIRKQEDIQSFFEGFGNTHNKIILYSDRKDNGLFPLNYAYEEISLSESRLDFEGKAYHITG